MRKSTLAFLAAATSMTAACGSPQPVVTMPPAVITATPPAPPPATRAKWAFSKRDSALRGKLDLGDGSVLFVGYSGRRELARGSDPWVDSPTILPADLVAAVKDDKGQIALVGDDGSVFVVHDPLGPADPVRPGPLGDTVKPGTALRAVTAGKSAIMGIAHDGRVFRSPDLGKSWQAVDYAAGTKPYGHPVSIALDAKGNGLLLHFPQRVFVTHDDGATWAPIASPGIGARSVQRDGDGALFLTGHYFTYSSGMKHARLEGAGLVATNDTPAPLSSPSSAKAPQAARASADHESGDKDDNKGGERRSERLLVGGDHVVELAEIFRHGKAREIEVGTAPLGEWPASGASSAELVGAQGMSHHVAAFGSDLVYLREDEDVDPSASTTTVFRSSDRGATWQKDAVLKGSILEETTGVDVALGPRGWTFVTALCPHYSPEGRKCSHRQIRTAGGHAFEDMEFDEELTPTELAFDEAHDRVYVVGIHNAYKYVYESPLGQNRFTRTKILDKAVASAATGITVDSKGTLRVMAYDQGKSEWILHRRLASGEELPLLYVPIDNGALAFAGLKGVLFTGLQHGWETGDGGETWVRVAANGTLQGLTCGPAGCVNGSSQRVGWDLPAVQDADRIAAALEPRATGSHGSFKIPAPPTQVDLVCKPTGGTTQLAATPGSEMVDGRSSDVRWASVKHEDNGGKTSIVFGTKTSVRETVLRGLAPKPPAPGSVGALGSNGSSSGERVLADGVVAGRFTPVDGAAGGDRTLEADLTWWSAATGRTLHHTLKGLKSYGVSGFSGMPQIVDGGLLYQTRYSEPAYFVHDDGKVETIPMPAEATVRNGERVGKRWIFGDASAADVLLSSSGDGGKTWVQKAWALDDYGNALVVLLGGKPELALSHGSQPAALFALDGDLPDDPPAPVVSDESAIDTPCDAKVGALRTTSFIPSQSRHLRVRVETPLPPGTPAPAGGSGQKVAGRLTANTRVTHASTQGRVCTSAFVLNGNDPQSYESQTAFLYPEGKGWSGWWFHRAVDPKDSGKKELVAQTLTCAEGAPEKRE